MFNIDFGTQDLTTKVPASRLRSTKVVTTSASDAKAAPLLLPVGGRTSTLLTGSGTGRDVLFDVKGKH